MRSTARPPAYRLETARTSTSLAAGAATSPPGSYLSAALDRVIRLKRAVVKRGATDGSAAAWQRARTRRFIASNVSVLAEGNRDFIQPVQQAFAVERVDVKGRYEPTRSNPLGNQVDRYLHARLLRCEPDQLPNFGLWELEGEKADTKAVALEDVAERRRDH